VDVFLYFFEAKSPGKKLWVSFNGATRRVSLTLFQQSYKGFKGKFFKIRCSKFDPTLLDGFPLYWVKEPGLKKPRCLEDLPPREREVCNFFSNLRAVFNTVDLLKLEYNPKSLKRYIGTPSSPILVCVSLCLCVLFVLNSYAPSSSYAGMVLNTEKRRQLAVVAAQLKIAPGPSASGPSAPAPIDQRLKGVVEVAEVAPSKDEDTCSGLVFKRKRHRAQMVKLLLTGSTLLVPLLLATSWCKRVGGRVPLGMTVVSPLLICQPSFSGRCNPSIPKRGWRTWRMTPCWITFRGTLGRLWLDPAFSCPRCRS